MSSHLCCGVCCSLCDSMVRPHPQSRCFWALPVLEGDELDVPQCSLAALAHPILRPMAEVLPAKFARILSVHHSLFCSTRNGIE